MLVQSFTVFVYRAQSSPTGPYKGGHGRGTTLGGGAAETRPAWAHADLLNPHPGPPPTPRTPPRPLWGPRAGGSDDRRVKPSRTGPPGVWCSAPVAPVALPATRYHPKTLGPSSASPTADPMRPVPMHDDGEGGTRGGRKGRTRQGGGAYGGRHRAHQRGGGGYGAEDHIQIRPDSA